MVDSGYVGRTTGVLAETITRPKRNMLSATDFTRLSRIGREALLRGSRALCFPRPSKTVDRIRSGRPDTMDEFWRFCSR